MLWKDKKVVVVGLGKSGNAALSLLKAAGAKVCLYDGKKDLEVSGYEEDVYLDSFDEDVFAQLDCAVFSPGVPLDIPIADFLRKNKVPIIGEIELAYTFEKGRVVGITGTNGKTTTTTLVGQIMKAWYDDTFVVGNIGVPYTEMVMKTTKDSVTVAEISSFQLETTDTFCPEVSAILNITPDHLNRHKTMENYIEAKFAIEKKQTSRQVCILNYEDKTLREKAKDLSAKVVFFSSKRPLEEGAFLDDKGDIVFVNSSGEATVVCNVSECKLLGLHSYENYMAAILMGIYMNIPIETIAPVVKSFAGVEHRVEFVKDFKGVNYYNDSKGTNPDAAIKAIESMNRKTVLIGGGYDKAAEFDEWIESFQGKVTYLILLGDTKEKIERTARRHGFQQIVMVSDLKEAVNKAYELAKEGEAVLLSPACASWDMFKSFEQRGELFKEYVNSLE